MIKVRTVKNVKINQLISITKIRVLGVATNNGESIKQYSQSNFNGCVTFLLSLSKKRFASANEQRSPRRLVA